MSLERDVGLETERLGPSFDLLGAYDGEGGALFERRGIGVAGASPIPGLVPHDPTAAQVLLQRAPFLREVAAPVGVDPGGQAAEAPLMGGQGQFFGEVADAPQRRQELSKWVGA